ncbi:MAG: hypothetical protein MHM6MM_002872 [Cercozoa sp. M6MM]
MLRRQVAKAAQLARDAANGESEESVRESVQSLLEHGAAPLVALDEQENDEEFTKLLPPQKTNVGPNLREHRLGLAAAEALKMSDVFVQELTSPTVFFKQLAVTQVAKQVKDTDVLVRLIKEAPARVARRLLHALVKHQPSQIEKIFPQVRSDVGTEVVASVLHRLPQEAFTALMMSDKDLRASDGLRWKMIVRFQWSYVLQLLHKRLLETVLHRHVAYNTWEQTITDLTGLSPNKWQCMLMANRPARLELMRLVEAFPPLSPRAGYPAGVDFAKKDELLTRVYTAQEVTERTSVFIGDAVYDTPRLAYNYRDMVGAELENWVVLDLPVFVRTHMHRFATLHPDWLSKLMIGTLGYTQRCSLHATPIFYSVLSHEKLPVENKIEMLLAWIEHLTSLDLLKESGHGLYLQAYDPQVAAKAQLLQFDLRHTSVTEGQIKKELRKLHDGIEILDAKSSFSSYRSRVCVKWVPDVPVQPMVQALLEHGLVLRIANKDVTVTPVVNDSTLHSTQGLTYLNRLLTLHEKNSQFKAPLLSTAQCATVLKALLHKYLECAHNLSDVSFLRERLQMHCRSTVLYCIYHVLMRAHTRGGYTDRRPRLTQQLVGLLEELVAQQVELCAAFRGESIGQEFEAWRTLLSQVYEQQMQCEDLQQHTSASASLESRAFDIITRKINGQFGRFASLAEATAEVQRVLKKYPVHASKTVTPVHTAMRQRLHAALVQRISVLGNLVAPLYNDFALWILPDAICVTQSVEPKLAALHALLLRTVSSFELQRQDLPAALKAQVESPVRRHTLVPTDEVSTLLASHKSAETAQTVVDFLREWAAHLAQSEHFAVDTVESVRLEKETQHLQEVVTLLREARDTVLQAADHAYSVSSDPGKEGRLRESQQGASPVLLCQALPPTENLPHVRDHLVTLVQKASSRLDVVRQCRVESVSLPASPRVVLRHFVQTAWSLVEYVKNKAADFVRGRKLDDFVLNQLRGLEHRVRHCMDRVPTDCGQIHRAQCQALVDVCLRQDLLDTEHKDVLEELALQTLQTHMDSSAKMHELRMRQLTAARMTETAQVWQTALQALPRVTPVVLARLSSPAAEQLLLRAHADRLAAAQAWPGAYKWLERVCKAATMVQEMLETQTPIVAEARKQSDKQRKSDRLTALDQELTRTLQHLSNNLGPGSLSSLVLRDALFETAPLLQHLHGLLTSESGPAVHESVLKLLERLQERLSWHAAQVAGAVAQATLVLLEETRATCVVEKETVLRAQHALLIEPAAEFVVAAVERVLTMLSPHKKALEKLQSTLDSVLTRFTSMMSTLADYGHEAHLLLQWQQAPGARAEMTRAVRVPWQHSTVASDARRLRLVMMDPTLSAAEVKALIVDTDLSVPDEDADRHADRRISPLLRVQGEVRVDANAVRIDAFGDSVLAVTLDERYAEETLSTAVAALLAPHAARVDLVRDIEVRQECVPSALHTSATSLLSTMRQAVNGLSRKSDIDQRTLNVFLRDEAAVEWPAWPETGDDTASKVLGVGSAALAAASPARLLQRCMRVYALCKDADHVEVTPETAVQKREFLLGLLQSLRVNTPPEMEKVLSQVELPATLDTSLLSTAKSLLSSRHLCKHEATATEAWIVVCNTLLGHCLKTDALDTLDSVVVPLVKSGKLCGKRRATILELLGDKLLDALLQSSERTFVDFMKHLHLPAFSLPQCLRDRVSGYLLPRVLPEALGSTSGDASSDSADAVPAVSESAKDSLMHLLDVANPRVRNRLQKLSDSNSVTQRIAGFSTLLRSTLLVSPGRRADLSEKTLTHFATKLRNEQITNRRLFTSLLLGQQHTFADRDAEEDPSFEAVMNTHHFWLLPENEACLPLLQSMLDDALEIADLDEGASEMALGATGEWHCVLRHYFTLSQSALALALNEQRQALFDFAFDLQYRIALHRLGRKDSALSFKLSVGDLVLCRRVLKQTPPAFSDAEPAFKLYADTPEQARRVCRWACQKYDALLQERCAEWRATPCHARRVLHSLCLLGGPSVVTEVEEATELCDTVLSSMQKHLDLTASLVGMANGDKEAEAVVQDFDSDAEGAPSMSPQLLHEILDMRPLDWTNVPILVEGVVRLFERLATWTAALPADLNTSAALLDNDRLQLHLREIETARATLMGFAATLLGSPKVLDIAESRKRGVPIFVHAFQTTLFKTLHVVLYRVVLETFPNDEAASRTLALQKTRLAVATECAKLAFESMSRVLKLQSLPVWTIRYTLWQHNACVAAYVDFLTKLAPGVRLVAPGDDAWRPCDTYLLKGVMVLLKKPALSPRMRWFDWAPLAALFRALFVTPLRRAVDAFEAEDDVDTVLVSTRCAVTQLALHLLPGKRIDDWERFEAFRECSNLLMRTSLAKYHLARWWHQRTEVHASWRPAASRRQRQERRAAAVDFLLQVSPSALHLRVVQRHLMRFDQPRLLRVLAEESPRFGVFYPSTEEELPVPLETELEMDETHFQAGTIDESVTGDQELQQLREVFRLRRRRYEEEKELQSKVSAPSEEEEAVLVDMADLSVSLNQQAGGSVDLDKIVTELPFDDKHLFTFLLCYGMHRVPKSVQDRLSHRLLSLALNADRSMPDRVTAIRRWTLLPQTGFAEVLTLWQALEQEALRAKQEGRIHLHGHVAGVLKCCLRGKRRLALKVTVHKAILRALIRDPTEEHLRMVRNEWRKEQMHRDARIVVLRAAIDLLRTAADEQAANDDYRVTTAWYILEQATRLDHIAAQTEVMTALAAVSPAENAVGSLSENVMRRVLRHELECSRVDTSAALREVLRRYSTLPRQLENGNVPVDTIASVTTTPRIAEHVAEFTSLCVPPRFVTKYCERVVAPLLRRVQSEAVRVAKETASEESKEQTELPTLLHDDVAYITAVFLPKWYALCTEETRDEFVRLLTLLAGDLRRTTLCPGSVPNDEGDIVVDQEAREKSQQRFGLTWQLLLRFCGVALDKYGPSVTVEGTSVPTFFAGSDRLRVAGNDERRENVLVVMQRLVDALTESVLPADAVAVLTQGETTAVESRFGQTLCPVRDAAIYRELLWRLKLVEKLLPEVFYTTTTLPKLSVLAEHAGEWRRQLLLSPVQFERILAQLERLDGVFALPVLSRRVKMIACRCRTSDEFAEHAVPLLERMVAEALVHMDVAAALDSEVKSLLSRGWWTCRTDGATTTAKLYDMTHVVEATLAQVLASSSAEELVMWTIVLSEVLDLRNSRAIVKSVLKSERMVQLVQHLVQALSQAQLQGKDGIVAALAPRVKSLVHHLVGREHIYSIRFGTVKTNEDVRVAVMELLVRLSQQRSPPACTLIWGVLSEVPLMRESNKMMRVLPVEILVTLPMPSVVGDKYDTLANVLKAWWAQRVSTYRIVDYIVCKPMTTLLTSIALPSVGSASVKRRIARLRMRLVLAGTTEMFSYALSTKQHLRMLQQVSADAEQTLGPVSGTKTRGLAAIELLKGLRESTQVSSFVWLCSDQSEQCFPDRDLLLSNVFVHLMPSKCTSLYRLLTIDAEINGWQEAFLAVFVAHLRQQRHLVEAPALHEARDLTAFTTAQSWLRGVLSVRVRNLSSDATVDDILGNEAVSGGGALFGGFFGGEPTSSVSLERRVLLDYLHVVAQACTHSSLPTQMRDTLATAYLTLRPAQLVSLGEHFSIEALDEEWQQRVLRELFANAGVYYSSVRELVRFVDTLREKAGVRADLLLLVQGLLEEETLSALHLTLLQELPLHCTLNETEEHQALATRVIDRLLNEAEHTKTQRSPSVTASTIVFFITSAESQRRKQLGRVSAGVSAQTDALTGALVRRVLQRANAAAVVLCEKWKGEVSDEPEDVALSVLRRINVNTLGGALSDEQCLQVACMYLSLAREASDASLPSAKLYVGNALAVCQSLRPLLQRRLDDELRRVVACLLETEQGSHDTVFFDDCDDVADRRIDGNDDNAALEMRFARSVLSLMLRVPTLQNMLQKILLAGDNAKALVLADNVFALLSAVREGALDESDKARVLSLVTSLARVDPALVFRKSKRAVQSVLATYMPMPEGVLALVSRLIQDGSVFMLECAQSLLESLPEAVTLQLLETPLWKSFLQLRALQVSRCTAGVSTQRAQATRALVSLCARAVLRLRARAQRLVQWTAPWDEAFKVPSNQDLSGRSDKAKNFLPDEEFGEPALQMISAMSRTLLESKCIVGEQAALDLLREFCEETAAPVAEDATDLRPRWNAVLREALARVATQATTSVRHEAVSVSAVLPAGTKRKSRDASAASSEHTVKTAPVVEPETESESESDDGAFSLFD